MHNPQNVADRKDIPVKSWRPAGQISSQWRQTNLWTVNGIHQADLQQRLAHRPLNVAKLRLQSRTFLTKASGYVACYYMYWRSVGNNHCIGFCVLHGTFQIIGYDWEKLGA
jgi:hypothetical protein